MSPALQFRTEMAPRPATEAAGRINVGFEEAVVRAHFRVAELARVHGLSVRQFERASAEQFRTCPRAVIHGIRMKLARELLLSDAPLKEIAVELGYRHPAHFARAFKAYYGMTPKKMHPASAPGIGRAAPDVAIRYEMSPIDNKTSHNGNKNTLPEARPRTYVRVVHGTR